MKLKFKPNLGAAKDRKGSSRGGGGGRQQGLVAGSRGGGGRKRGPSTSCEESTGEESGTDYDREIGENCCVALGASPASCHPANQIA